MDESFNPEKYGMLSCFECDGNGKLLNEFEDIEVCPRCGGFGFIKKEEDPDKNGIVSLIKIINIEEKSDV
jgi:RecJ-like exonuclease